VTDISVETLIEKLSNDLTPLFATADQPVIIGIETGGFWIAQEIHNRLNPETELGKLNITFYRDDFTKTGLHPTVKPSRLPTDIDGKTIVLVDDVLHSGRTIRAAMNEIFDYGRPDRIVLAILIDRGDRELPIQADYVAHRMTLDKNEQIKLEGPKPYKLTLQQLTTE
jgi:pyrimidine operon attenuation protein / uracil phosphoribosyltransferase